MEASTVRDLLLRARELRPDAVAVRDSAGAWTYEEVTRHSYGFALWLHSRGIGPRDRVLFEATSRRTTIAALYGCSMAGASAVPLSPNAGTREIEHALRDAEPCLAMFDEPVTLGEHTVTSAREVWRRVTPTQATTSEIRALAEPSRDDPALLIYTSGSTGVPKAVVCPSAQVLFSVSAIAEQLQYASEDVIFCRLPLSFDYGLYQSFLAAFAMAELVLDPGGVDGRVLEKIKRSCATVVPLVPSLASMLLRLARGRQVDCAVRPFTNTGEELAPDVVHELRRRFPGAGVQLMYGTTECKRVSILAVDGDHAKPGSVGRPLTGTEVCVLDGSGHAVQAGTVGEIVVSGPHVMAGYWNAPDLSKQVFTWAATGEALLHTGDFGHLDDDGHLYIAGRRDSVFKRLGVRTSTGEIEAAVRAIPDVTDTAVLPPEAGRDAVLFVVTVEPDITVLRQLRRLLSPQKVPGIYCRLDSIPRQRNGKVDRQALRALAQGSA